MNRQLLHHAVSAYLVLLVAVLGDPLNQEAVVDADELQVFTAYLKSLHSQGEIDLNLLLDGLTQLSNLALHATAGVKFKQISDVLGKSSESISSLDAQYKGS